MALRLSILALDPQYMNFKCFLYQFLRGASLHWSERTLNTFIENDQRNPGKKNERKSDDIHLLARKSAKKRSDLTSE
jgi:hypothetical protein